MSKVLASIHGPDGQLLHIDAGFDPPLNIHFLDVYAEGQEDPVFMSTAEHPTGLFRYTVADLDADLTRVAGRTVPAVAEAIVALGPVANAVTRLGHL